MLGNNLLFTFEYNIAVVAVVVCTAFQPVLTHADSKTDRLTGNIPVESSGVGNKVMVDTPTARQDYREFYAKIITGKATLSEIKHALSEQDPAALSNSLHALYAMRWHRGVLHLLNGIWREDRKRYPAVAWEQLLSVPARIALASTLNRIRIINTQEFKDYIRAHKNHPHEFVTAQVVIALGLNGDPQDLPYLHEMADGDNHYVAQSAITAIAMAGGQQSQAVLEMLAKKHRGTSRGDMVRELLRTAYNIRSPQYSLN